MKERRVFVFTCRQSKAVLTIRLHFDWHASSKGKKYLSASTNSVPDFGRGKADEVFVPWLQKKRIIY